MNQNPYAWAIWIVAAAIITIIARNPLYTIIILIVSRIMVAAFASIEDDYHLPFWRIAIVILLISAGYNALFVHVGQTVLFTLPDWPLIGGSITLEAVVDGARNGLILVTLLSIFFALNAIVPTGDLIKLSPAAFQDMSVAILITLTYVPETRRQLQRIREAQAIRGHEIHGLRDYRPLVIPLLVGGLERAMRLAETMVARGYGATRNINPHPAERIALIVAMIGALIGWLLTFWRPFIGWLLLLVSVAIVGMLVWRRGRMTPRTHFKPSKWGFPEGLLVSTAVIALSIVVLPWPFVDGSTLFYSPYPLLHFPSFGWVIGLALAAMVFPALIRS
jgi:energy-coupling factor transport system permease protein